MAKRKTSEQVLVENILDGREVEVLSSKMIRKTKYTQEAYDMSVGIPGTVPEKIIYNYLTASEVEFFFQYNYADNRVTALPEGMWIADFYLPAYNIYIEVYGNYWHSIDETVDKDYQKKAFWNAMGLEVIDSSRAEDLVPSKTAQVGKVVIWWEKDIYADVSGLFARDLPEISVRKIPGKAHEVGFDAIAEMEKRELNSKILKLRKSKAQIKPLRLEVKKLKKKAISANFFERNIELINTTRKIKRNDY